jgi:hypothetical protein
MVNPSCRHRDCVQYACTAISTVHRVSQGMVAAQHDR